MGHFLWHWRAPNGCLTVKMKRELMRFKRTLPFMKFFFWSILSLAKKPTWKLTHLFAFCSNLIIFMSSCSLTACYLSNQDNLHKATLIFCKAKRKSQEFDSCHVSFFLLELIADLMFVTQPMPIICTSRAVVLCQPRRFWSCHLWQGTEIFRI